MKPLFATLFPPPYTFDRILDHIARGLTLLTLALTLIAAVLIASEILVKLFALVILGLAATFLFVALRKKVR